MMAWLSAVPRRRLSNGQELKEPARIEAYRSNDIAPPLPPLTARHIFEWLMEVGPTESNGMGRMPVSWATLRYWQEQAGLRLSPRESRLLRRLSSVFLTESMAAEDPLRPAPWIAPASQVDHDANERQLRAVLG